MRIACRLCALVLCIIASAYALSQDNKWDKVRYSGGTLQSDVDPSDWNNQLTVSSGQIALHLADGRQAEFLAKSVTGLSYGQEAYQRIRALAKIAVPGTESESALFGFRKTRIHFIGIEYRALDGKNSGLLLQGNKDNYRAILKAIEDATGASVATSEKDREYLTETSSPKIAAQPEKPQPEKPKPEKPQPPSSENSKGKAVKPGTLSINSSPKGANVAIDGTFMGNTPASLKLSPGDHSVTVSLGGYKDWVTAVTIVSGSTVPVRAELEKE
jgi:hypothetical protein